MTERPIGIGCMRVAGAAPIVAALEAGATLLDTARAYGDSERLVAEALRRWGGERARVTVVTKCGMRMPGWIPDGRARAVRADCEASLAALEVDALDVLLLHAPDPALPLATSVRALARLQAAGRARRIGLSNVTVQKLREALALAPIEVVEARLQPGDGLVEECERRGILLLAHSPLGGPKRAARLSLEEGARALAALRALSPVVVPIPGVTRVETARAAVAACRLVVPAAPPPATRAARAGAEVVLIMGPPASGKSSLARELVDRGYARLNRDERGGTLRGVAQRLAARLDSGETRFVLDNTYHTRAARHTVLQVARARGVPVRGLWIDTPLEETQVNAVERILDLLGALPAPDELAAASKRDPQVLSPLVPFRYRRELEPPEVDEGFAALETVPFRRRPRPDHDRAATVFTLDTLARAEPGDAVDGRLLALGWTADAPRGAPPDGVDLLLCAHGGGPPRCWCRPPLPGALVHFVRKYKLDPSRSTLVGTTPAHRALAAAVGFRYHHRP